MHNNQFLLINKSKIAATLSTQDYMRAVENAMTLHGRGQVLTPDLLHVDATGGEFHIKVGGLKGDRTYFGLKANGGFFSNRAKYNLPNIWGIIYLSDGSTGEPLAVLESTEISINRTAAASALAASKLAKQNSSVITIVGTGTQSLAQLKFFSGAFPLARAFVFGRDEAKAKAFSASASSRFGIDVIVTSDLKSACADSDIIVTCTTSREFLVHQHFVQPGTFIAAVGADSPGKQELDPSLVATSKVICDVKSQCLEVGELQHAIKQGLIEPDDVYAELGEVLVGRLPGRVSQDEIIIYDSTGTALQDIACAAAVYEKVSFEGSGDSFELFN